VQLAPAGKRLLRGLDRRSPSQLEGGTQVRLAQRLRLDASQAMDRGSVLHAWFELVEWLDDGEPDDEALRKATGTLLCCGLDLTSLIGQFRKALARPAVREVFSRATYERPAQRGSAACIHAGPKIARPEWIVSRECPFAVRDGDAILSGKIDRLVVLRDGERTVGADIIDFKTDAVSAEEPEALSARVAWYRPQLESYRRAAATFLRLDPKEISTRLVFTEPGLVVPVDHTACG
jgi:ATP-dependent exoDNAse (exonuclease V) beta subunit